MKRNIILFALFLSCALNAAEAKTNLLSIHLFAENISPQWPPGTIIKPDALKLVSAPVLSDADFVSFNFNEQTFTITHQAAMRLVIALSGDEPPYMYNGGVYAQIPSISAFVLKASDVPIYVGTFTTPTSSSAVAAPVIMADAMFINPNSTTNVSFSIEPGYPGEFPGIADQMRDPRIQAAVNKLFPRFTLEMKLVLGSIIAVALLSALGFWIFPGLRSGIRNFRDASDHVTQQLRGDDDDDDPHPA